MKEEKEAEELEEKEKAKAKMMHGQWMQKTFGKAQKRAKRASWSWGRSSCEVLEILENHILMVFIWKICQLPGKRTHCVDAEATLCHFD
jgi:hypothetical protein